MGPRELSWCSISRADKCDIQDTGRLFWGVGPTGSGLNEWGKVLERLRRRFKGFALVDTQFVNPNAPPCARLFLFHVTYPHPNFNIMSSHPAIYNGKRYPTSFHLYQSLKVCKPMRPFNPEVLTTSQLRPK